MAPCKSHNTRSKDIVHPYLKTNMEMHCCDLQSAATCSLLHSADSADAKVMFLAAAPYAYIT